MLLGEGYIPPCCQEIEMIEVHPHAAGRGVHPPCCQERDGRGTSPILLREMIEVHPPCCQEIETIEVHPHAISRER